MQTVWFDLFPKFQGERVMRTFYALLVLAVATLALLLILSTESQAVVIGGVYYPSHPGAPMWSYYTGHYGSGWRPGGYSYGTVPQYRYGGYGGCAQGWVDFGLSFIPRPPYRDQYRYHEDRIPPPPPARYRQNNGNDPYPIGGNLGQYVPSEDRRYRDIAPFIKSSPFSGAGPQILPARKGTIHIP